MAGLHRPVVLAAAGGTAQCSQLCDRTSGCAGFIIDGNACLVVNSIGVRTSAPAYGPVFSYARSASPASVRSRSQAPFAQARARAQTPALPTAPTSVPSAPSSRFRLGQPSMLEWWVAPSTEHVFPQDRAWMTQWCPSPQRMHWQAAPGTAVASQVALRLLDGASGDALCPGNTPLQFAFTDLRLTGPQGGSSGAAAGTIAASALSARQVGLVGVDVNDKYTNENGAGMYPDALFPIHTPNASTSPPGGGTPACYHASCSDFVLVCTGGATAGVDGCRFSYDRGGRQIAFYTVRTREQCQTLCTSNPVCRGVVLQPQSTTNTTLCRLVNDSAVTVGTVQQG